MDVYKKEHFQTIHRLIDQGRFKNAFQKIEEYPYQTNEDKRIKSQLQSKVFIRKNQYKKGILKLYEGLQYGEHLSLYADLTSAYFLNNDFENWSIALENLNKKFQAVYPKLTEEYQIKLSIQLGNHLEENAQIFDAYLLYSKIFKSMKERLKFDRPYEVKLMCQLLRFSIYIKKDESFPFIYRQLLIEKKKSHSRYASVTVQHALLLYEAVHVGVQTALHRLKEIKKTNQKDYSFLFFELIEIILAKDLSLESVPILRFKKPKPACAYEKVIYRIFYFKNIAPVFKNLSKTEDQLSMANLIQVLNLIKMKTKDQKIKKEIQNKLNLLLSQLSIQNQKMWLAKYSSQIKESELVLCRLKKIVFIGNEEYRLFRKKTQFSFLEFFISKKEATFEELARFVWKAQYNPSYYDRIRRTVERIHLVFSLPLEGRQLFAIQGEKVQLKTHFTLSEK